MFPVHKIVIYFFYRTRYYGKRSVGGYGDLEELEAIQERVSEMFHRASQIDGAQCVRRLICEVNAGSRLKYSVRLQDSCEFHSSFMMGSSPT